MSIPRGHVHAYHDWFNSGTCQRRLCDCGNHETRDHSWGNWETIEMRDHRGRVSSSVKQRSCGNCGATETK